MRTSGGDAVDADAQYHEHDDHDDDDDRHVRRHHHHHGGRVWSCVCLRVMRAALQSM